MVKRKAADNKIQVCFAISTVMHLAVFLLFYWWNLLFPFDVSIKETYYVDIVNLPVVSPRAGSPVQQGDDQIAPTPPSVGDRQMTMPESSQTKRIDTSKKSAEKKGSTDVESSEFARKMAKLQGKADAQDQEAAIQRIQRRLAGGTGKGRSGMPGGTGHEAGSRMADYIQSRLKDALERTFKKSTRKPVVDVKIAFGSRGRIIRYRVMNSSGDKLFEKAVFDAIELAKEPLQRMQNKDGFNIDVRFTPDEVVNKKP